MDKFFLPISLYASLIDLHMAMKPLEKDILLLRLGLVFGGYRLD